jgi:c-di-GMP phosphodiesterase
MLDSPLLACVPILTRDRATVGYDLTLVSTHGERAAAGGIAALVGPVGGMPSLFEALPTRCVFADCSQVEAEGSPATAGRFILCLRADDAIDDPAAAVSRWKRAGFGLCLDLRDLQDWPPPLLAQASHIRLDDARTGSKLTEVTGQLRGLSAKKVLAGVHTHAAFQRALSAGCDLCQGYFFTQPTGAPAHAVNASYTNIVNLMKLAQSDAPIAKLEELLKRDAALSFKLLRYINSAGFGLSCEIQSFRHAVTVLGYQNLHKWLALLLVTAARQSQVPALVTTAVGRGRLAELLGHGLFEAPERDNLFITGAFSLLPAILQTPLDQIAEQVALPDAVSEALVRRSGPFGPLLDLVLTLETLDQPGSAERVAELAMSLGLAHDALNRAQMQALVWAESLAQ